MVRQLSRLLGIAGAVLSTAMAAQAAIYEWTTDAQGNVIESMVLCPDGADVSAVPNADFSQRDLSKAFLVAANLEGVEGSEATLTNADLSRANLLRSDFYMAVLTNANLSQANLQFGDFSGATLAGAILEDADVRSTLLSGTTRFGFTRAQFESTASFKSRDLSGVGLGGCDLRDWDFSGHNLTGADFATARMTNTKFTDADIRGARFYDVTRFGFTQSQLKSTASYKAFDLSGVLFLDNDLIGWDFTSQNLTRSGFTASNLTNARFTGANLERAYFGSAIMTNAILDGAVLRRASFSFASLPRASLKNADLTDAWLYLADLSGATLIASNFTRANLRSSRLSGAVLTDADLSGSDLSYARLNDATLTNANLSGANLQFADFTNAVLDGAELAETDGYGADWRGAVGVDSAVLSAANAILPDGRILGLRLTGDSWHTVIYNYAREPGQLPIPIRIAQEMQVEQWHSIELTMDTEPWNSTISFDPGIPVSLSGDLFMKLPAEGAESLVGKTFKLFDWTGVSPEGELRIIGNGIWDDSQLYSEGTVRLIAVPEPGALALLTGALAAWLLARKRTCKVRPPAHGLASPESVRREG